MDWVIGDFSILHQLRELLRLFQTTDNIFVSLSLSNFVKESKKVQTKRKITYLYQRFSQLKTSSTYRQYDILNSLAIRLQMALLKFILSRYSSTDSAA